MRSLRRSTSVKRRFQRPISSRGSTIHVQKPVYIHPLRLPRPPEPNLTAKNPLGKAQSRSPSLLSRLLVCQLIPIMMHSPVDLLSSSTRFTPLRDS